MPGRRPGDPLREYTYWMRGNRMVSKAAAKQEIEKFYRNVEFLDAWESPKPPVGKQPKPILSQHFEVGIWRKVQEEELGADGGGDAVALKHQPIARKRIERRLANG